MAVSIQSVRSRSSTLYRGTQAELIEAGIVPPDFFSFRGPSRYCSRSWYGKKIPSTYTFPDGVEQIGAKKRGGSWAVNIRHKLDSPPYVPPGETWQIPEPEPECSADAQRARMQDVYHFASLDDTGTAAPLIGTSCVPTRARGKFVIGFSGTREQLINAGIATAAMFPEGMTPTGRPRTYKNSGKHSPTSWHVAQDGSLWRVYFYDVEPEEADPTQVAKANKMRTKLTGLVDGIRDGTIELSEAASTAFKCFLTLVSWKDDGTISVKDAEELLQTSATILRSAWRI